MRDKQKAIEEMTEVIPYDIIRYDQKPKGQHLYWEQRKEIAEALVNANYGNIEQALTEFAKKITGKVSTRQEIIYVYGEHYSVRDYFSKILHETLKEFLANANLS